MLPIFYLSILVMMAVASSNQFRRDFIAAVYEHPAISSYAKTRPDALAAMRQNLEVFDYQARIAKQNGADIIVFPEYGLTGDTEESNRVPDPRQVMHPYMEIIPDVTNPPLCSLCSDNIEQGTEAHQLLACIAKSNQIYVVGNMIEEKPCDQHSDSGCPHDLHYQYNTNVAFDRAGCLIAKYRKQNLYGSEAKTLDHPEHPQYGYFDTEFGRFGTMICFDALFKEPGIPLVETYRVDHILFPTYWDNNNDYHWARSNQWFVGWAARMGVNFIASNYNNISFESQGSVLASPFTIVNYTFDATNQYGKLLIGKLPSSPRCAARQTILPQITEPLKFKPKYYQSYGKIGVYGELYNATIIQGHSGLVSVCSEDLCCNLMFRRSIANETYVLSAFVGMQRSEGPYHVEVCLLYRCPNKNLESCSERVYSSSTAFTFFSLSATFNAQHVFPNILPSHYRYDKIDLDFRRDGFVNEVTGGSSWPLVSAALVGRDFTKDEV